jgi:hypothetical protein
MAFLSFKACESVLDILEKYEGMKGGREWDFLLYFGGSASSQLRFSCQRPERRDRLLWLKQGIMTGYQLTNRISLSLARWLTLNKLGIVTMTVSKVG